VGATIDLADRAAGVGIMGYLRGSGGIWDPRFGVLGVGRRDVGDRVAPSEIGVVKKK
jgi:hypothetical protein